MSIDFKASIQVLANTPNVLTALLHNIDGRFIFANEGPGTWNPFDVTGHLIVCEKTNFMERIKFILSDADGRQLKPMDMSAHVEEGMGKSIGQLLQEFRELRSRNLEALQALDVQASDFTKTAIHPTLGEVNVSNVLSTWVAHDLSHIGQVARLMAKQYKTAVGAFIQFLPQLRS